MKFLYKYPQRRVSVRAASSRRTGGAHAHDPEFELLDTGVFDDDRYFDVVVEYAKAIARRHPDAASRSSTAAPTRRALHLLPTLWFRNTLVLGPATRRRSRAASEAGERRGARSSGRDRELGTAHAGAPRARPSCCSPRTRPTSQRLFGAAARARFVKDGINDYVVRRPCRRRSTRRSEGTKAAAHYQRRRSQPGATIVDPAAAVGRRPRAIAAFGDDFDAVFARADPRGRRVLRDASCPRRWRRRRATVMRQALAGMLWSKQFYHYDVARLARGRSGAAAAAGRRG